MLHNTELRTIERPSCRIDDQVVRQFELTNRRGMAVVLMEYGATILSVSVPDAIGKRVQITLGLPDPQQYIHNPAHFGGICGRVANRISHSRFSLNGHLYQLAANNGAHHLHGGLVGFDRKHWRATRLSSDEYAGVRLEYTSANGEEGYPGTLSCRVEYTLNEASELVIRYQATVEGSPTPVNLTNHSYWNLAGAGSVLGHHIEIPGRSIVAVDQELIPTGVIQPVAGTPFDFTLSTAIGERLKQLSVEADGSTNSGFDHCYLVTESFERGTSDLKLAARLTEPVSGRVMEVLTDQPGVQFYTGAFLDGGDAVGGHDRYGGLCLECQQLPDAPNQPLFPSIVLNPGETYDQTSMYRLLW